MARLILVPQGVPGPYPVLPLTAESADFTWVASGASFADGFSFPLTGKELLLIRNDNAAPQTVTIDSVPAKRTSRTGDIETYSIGIGEYAVFGPFSDDGWQQTTGSINGEVSAADLSLAILKW